MKNKKKIIFIVPSILFGIILILLIGTFTKKENNHTQIKKVPQELFQSIDYFTNQKIFEPGDDYIINFFASWCKPCLLEHPLLMELDKKGIKIIGINFRDGENEFNQWLEEHGNPFSQIIRDEGDLAFEFGLIGVPETLFISNQIIEKKIQGPLFYEDIEPYL
jgi:DsbE subfamily thiol:disulfide oxidoreductase